MRTREWLGAVAVLVGGCVGTGEEIVLDVAHNLNPCREDQNFRLCLQAKESDEIDYQRFAPEIQGWEHTWGINTRLRIFKQKTINARTGDSFRYVFDEELRNDPVDPGTRFSYAFQLIDQTDDTPGLVVDGDGGALLDGTPFTCEPTEVCDDLTEALDGNGTMVVDLRYADPITDPLVVLDVRLVGLSDE